MSEMWRVLLLEESRSRFDEEGGGTGKRTEFGGFCGLGDGGERGEGEGEGNPPRQMPAGIESGIRNPIFGRVHSMAPPGPQSASRAGTARRAEHY